MAGETNEVNWRGVRPVSGIRGVWPARNSQRAITGGYQAGVGVTIIYTVPVGKLLFIASAYASSRNSAAAVAAGFSFVRNAADVYAYPLLYHYYTVAGQLSDSASFLPALEVPAGYDVVVQVTAAGIDARCNIFGWLEDA